MVPAIQVRKCPTLCRLRVVFGQAKGSGALFAPDEHMARWLVILLVLMGVQRLAAESLPLRASEISLMLRSGYSSDAVLAELKHRKFADVFDSNIEQQLLKSGAKPALIEALRNGTYQLSAAEIAAARDQAFATKARMEAQASRVSNNGNQVMPAQTGTSLPNSPVMVQIGGTMYDHLKDDLVYWHEGSLVPFDNEVLQKKKFYLLFFSGFWSKEGRQFTSQLVDYYNRVVPQHPELEVVFFSVDRSEFVMQDYITKTNMPWPALAYDKRNGKAGAIQDSLVHTIPHLILADASGKILSDSGDGQPNFDKVLADLDKVLATSK